MEGSGITSLPEEVIARARNQERLYMTLDSPASFVEACQQIFPIHPLYANLPIEQGFNWDPCLQYEAFDSLYLVVFRSVRRASADLDLLREFDDRAYSEASNSGGLLRYFKGEMNEQRECLSFCLWETRDQARAAASGPSHGRAAGITASMYESYRLYRYSIVRVHGKLSFQPLGEQAQEFGLLVEPLGHERKTSTNSGA